MSKLFETSHSLARKAQTHKFTNRNFSSTTRRLSLLRELVKKISSLHYPCDFSKSEQN